MDTMARLNELMAERKLSLYGLAHLCGIPYSTLKNTAARNGQISLETIEKICRKLEMPTYEFFMTAEEWEGIEAYALKRLQLREQQAEYRAG